MRAIPDIYLGPGDTAPSEEIILLDPPKAGASRGEPMNLQNAELSQKTVVFVYQNRNTNDPHVTRAVLIRQVSPTEKRGAVVIDWLSTGGPVVPPGSDHDARFIVTDNTGHQTTIPNVGQGYWLQVAPAYRT